MLKSFAIFGSRIRDLEAIMGIHLQALKRAGWKRVAALNAACIGILSLFLFGVFVYGCARAGGLDTAIILFSGPCTRSKKLNLLLHLVLNILGTLILASSNFFMQILNAPSRQDLDRAHARSAWVNIGVQSLRNLFHIGPLKLVCWAILACSSIPLHLFFNSLVFEVAEIQSNFGLTIASESFVEGAQYSAPGASLWNTRVPYNCSTQGLPGHEVNDKLCKSSIYDKDPIWMFDGNVFPVSWMNNTSDERQNISHAAAAQSNSSRWEKLDAAACRSQFLFCNHGQGLADYLNVVVVVDNDGRELLGWSRDQVFPNMTGNHTAFWKDIIPANETNSLWNYESCQLYSSFDGGKCENSCKPNLGYTRVYTNDVYTMDPKNDTGDESWVFSFWDDVSLGKGILKGQMRSGFDEQYNTINVKYCLAEKNEQMCKIGMSNTLLFAVLICVIVKTAMCLFVMMRFILRQDQHPLVTLGDAIDSLIRRPDPTTSHMCTLEMHDIQTNLLKYFKVSRTLKDCEHAAIGVEVLHTDAKHELVLPAARQWKKKAVHSFKAIPQVSWLRAYVFFLVLLAVSLYFFGQATGGSFRVSGAFGTSGTNNFVVQDNTSSDKFSGNFVHMVLLANIPQLILSISYLQLNSLLTKLSMAQEWALMNVKYSPLRVTDPKGDQVSTYRLQLPYSWAIPCIASGILVHWLVSNACYVFLADGGFYSSRYAQSSTEGNANLGLLTIDFVAVGYSTSGIIASIIAFAAVICVPLGLSLRKLSGSMVIAGSNSLAIAAACHASPVSKTKSSPSEVSDHQLRRSSCDTWSVGSATRIMDSHGIEMAERFRDSNEKVLSNIAESRIKWGVVNMPSSFYEGLNDDIEAMEINHLSFGVEADNITAPVFREWYA